jgi:hypothetical protein
MKPEDKAVVQQALEALEDAVLDYGMGKGAVARHVEAITALRQLLGAEAVQADAPVGECVVVEVDGGTRLVYMYVADAAYTLPAGHHQVYTTPPAQPAAWVGLTEAERRVINYQWRDGNGTSTEIMDLVEAKLREKNGGAA